LKKRDLIKHLKLHGCIQLKGGSKHDKWFNPSNNQKTAVPRHNDLNTFTARSICKQLGIAIIEGK